VLIDAFGSSGRDKVTGHADAGISAGNDIRTVKALGGGLNVLGGNSTHVVALGSSHRANNSADATATASLTAGDNVTISAKSIHVLGGAGDSVTAGSTSGVFSDAFTANLDAGATIDGGNAVTLTTTGDVV